MDYLNTSNLGATGHTNSAGKSQGLESPQNRVDQKMARQEAAIGADQAQGAVRPLREHVAKLLTNPKQLINLFRKTLEHNLGVTGKTARLKGSQNPDSPSKGKVFKQRVLWSVAVPKVEKMLVKQNIPSSQEVSRTLNDQAGKSLKMSDLRPAKEVAEELELSPLQARNLEKLYQKGDVQEVVKFIMETKVNGLQRAEANKVLQFIFNEASSIPGISQSSSAVMKEFKLEVSWESKILSRMRIPAKVAGVLNIKLAQVQLSRASAEMIIRRCEKKAAKGSPVGAVISEGFPGHATAMEVEKKGDVYLIHMANAGEGCVADGQNCQSVRTFSFPATKEGRRDLAKTLRRLEGLRTAGFKYSDSQNFGEEMYGILRANSTEIIDIGVGTRPVQTAGNCTIRSPEELLCHKLQQMGQHKDATRFKGFIRDISTAALEQSGEPVTADMVSKEPPFIPRMPPKFRLVGPKGISYDVPKGIENRNISSLTQGGLVSEAQAKALQSWSRNLKEGNPLVFNPPINVDVKLNGIERKVAQGEGLELKSGDILDIGSGWKVIIP